MSELVKNPKSDSNVCATLVAANEKQQSIRSRERHFRSVLLFGSVPLPLKNKKLLTENVRSFFM